MDFDENKKIESYFTAAYIPGTVLPSERGLLPVHLRKKSLTELVEHMCLLMNRRVLIQNSAR